MSSRLLNHILIGCGVALLPLGAAFGYGTCLDSDSDTYFRSAGCGTPIDCNDDNPAIFPGAMEICTGLDNDCDGVVDNDPTCDRTCDAPEKIGVEQPVSDTQMATGLTSIVWNGTEYGAAWVDRFGPGTSIVFASIDPNGPQIGTPIAVHSTSANPFGLSMVWTGTHFGIAWDELIGSNTGSIHFALLDSTGQKIGSTLDVISGLGLRHGAPDLVWSGSEFAITWDDKTNGLSEVSLARISAAGDQVLGFDQGANVVGVSEASSVAWSGTQYGYVWQDSRGDGSGQTKRIYYGSTSAAGAEIINSTIVANEPFTALEPEIAWDGVDYGIAWKVERDGGVFDIRFRKLSADGFQLGTDVRITEGVETSELIWTGEEYAIVVRRPTAPNELALVRFDSDGANVSELTVIASSAFAPVPSLAWNGETYALLFRDDSGSGSDAYYIEISCNCIDDDLDGLSDCAGDCDDGYALTFPGAPEICDGRNNDCNDPVWPQLPPIETDGDGDSFTDCDGDCDDLRGQIYPGAPQICDGINNDCDDALWPAVPVTEADSDGDSFLVCQNDCDDANPSVRPDATESCNGVDDNCNGATDEDALGEDSDADGVFNLCDNCVTAFNPSQLDTDVDGLGNGCDNCLTDPNPGQEDLDADGRGDRCDNCPATVNSFQDDFDADRVGDACDNCLFEPNPSQSDIDGDAQGDLCDSNDGLIYIRFFEPDYLEWEDEIGFPAWNAYRGDLSELIGSGLYTQAPGSNPLAARVCGTTDLFTEEIDLPVAGTVAFYLVSGINGAESGLGESSGGAVRVNDAPCP